MELLKLIFERAEALNSYWNLYIAVSLGVLTLMASGKPFTKQRYTKLFLSIAFACFAVSNLDVLYNTNVQRGILVTLAEPPFVEAAAHAGPPPHWQLFSFHGALDVIVVLCIWFVPWYSKLKNE